MFRALFGMLKFLLTTVMRAVLMVCKMVYALLSFLHIRLLALYVLVCALLSIFLPVFGEGIAWFWGGFGVCAAVTLICWLMALSRAFAARPRAPAREAEEEKYKEQEDGAENTEPAAPAPVPAFYPRYYDVEGQPDYFFAEYADRYELYKKEQGGAVFIRADRK